MATANPSEAWRPLAATLADDDALATYARLILGASVSDALTELPDKRHPRIVAALERAGILTTVDGTATLAPGNAFAALLAAAPARRRVGVERFIRDGRLESYPIGEDERFAVLRWIAEHAFHPGEDLTEAQVNERLTVFTRDFVTLRRYLVDFGLLERTRSGTSYALVVG